MTGTRRRIVPLAAAALLAVGCVDRRYVIESNVPSAQTFTDGVPTGLAPADNRYEYAGYRTIQVVAPGYEPATERVRFKPRWYDYPPLDLIAELLPYRIEDVRRVNITLVPARPVNQAELVANADALRATGRGLRESVVPDTPPARPPAGGVNGPPPPPPSDGPPRPFQGNLFPAPAPSVGDPGAAPGTSPAGPGQAPGR